MLCSTLNTIPCSPPPPSQTVLNLSSLVSCRLPGNFPATCTMGETRPHKKPLGRGMRELISLGLPEQCNSMTQLRLASLEFLFCLSKLPKRIPSTAASVVRGLCASAHCTSRLFSKLLPAFLPPTYKCWLACSIARVVVCLAVWSAACWKGQLFGRALAGLLMLFS